jgi:hypothetical protein
MRLFICVSLVSAFLVSCAPACEKGFQYKISSLSSSGKQDTKYVVSDVCMLDYNKQAVVRCYDYNTTDHKYIKAYPTDTKVNLDLAFRTCEL